MKVLVQQVLRGQCAPGVNPDRTSMLDRLSVNALVVQRCEVDPHDRQCQGHSKPRELLRNVRLDRHLRAVIDVNLTLKFNYCWMRR